MNLLKPAVLMTLAGLAAPALATNGTMPHGYGIKAQGMGGASIALPQDAIAAANNPAGMAIVGNRLDAGLTWLKADRGATIGGTYLSANDKDNYFIPDFGYNRVIDDRLSAGISVIGNGVGTRYSHPVGPPTNSNAGSELMQVVLSPTLAYKISPGQAIGVSLNVAYQRLDIRGVEHVGLANQGFEHAFGYGLALGWSGKLSDQVTLGASYVSKTHMGKLDKYRSLLAGGGEFDIPEHFGIGIAYMPTPTVTLAADALRVSWSDIRSIGNSLTSAGAFGADNGPGFGWKDQNVFRVGINVAASDTLELRAGYSHGSQIIPSGETTLNYLAPVTPQKHLSAGLTWRLDKQVEMNLAYTRTFDSMVVGSGASLGIDPRHSQHLLGASVGWTY
ncbi:OmpP1/FadL family transporter [Actimicrobium antarcticum]|uniref:Outer membrane protein transport protein n=1 Tax=Actimicrobium antarcticum TaxID=1051899 RepID=A0ABP7SXM8_9BURK